MVGAAVGVGYARFGGGVSGCCAKFRKRSPHEGHCVVRE